MVVLQQAMPDRGWRIGIARDLLGDDGAGLGHRRDRSAASDSSVKCLRLLFCVLRLLHIEIGHDPQQRGPDVDAVAIRQRSSPLSSGLFSSWSLSRALAGASVFCVEVMAARTFAQCAGKCAFPELSATSVSEPLTMAVLNCGADRSAAADRKPSFPPVSGESGMGIIVQFPEGHRPVSGGRYVGATSEPASVIILPVVRIERHQFPRPAVQWLGRRR